jgi:hypothetical protein
VLLCKKTGEVKMIDQNDPLNYLHSTYGYVLNSLDGHVERLGALIESESNVWLEWNKTNIKGDPVELPACTYQELFVIYHKIAKAVKRFQVTLKTTLIVVLDYDAPLLEKKEAVHCAMLKKGHYESGWFAGQTLFNNFYALVDVLNLHLAKLRKRYDEQLDRGEMDRTDLHELQDMLKSHGVAMFELCSNILFTLDREINRVIEEFKYNIKVMPQPRA